MDIFKVFSRKLFFVLVNCFSSLCATNCGNFLPNPDLKDEIASEILSNNLKGKDLCLAAKDGNLQKIDLLITQGVDVDFREYPGSLTPLMFAVLNDHLDIAKLLIKNKANVNASSHKTVLGFAQNLVAAKLLLDNGANVNAKYGDEENTPLLDAAEKGCFDKVKLFIDHGADINYRNKDGNTSLMLASSNGHIDIVKFLVEKKVDLNKSGSQAMLLAADCYSIEIVEYLKDCGVKIEPKYINGKKMFFVAAINNSLYLLELLLENGADVNSQDEKGRTALMFAVKHGAILSVLFLLKSGADINAQSKKGLSALDYAKKGLEKAECKEVYKEMIEMLSVKPNEVSKVS